MKQIMGSLRAKGGAFVVAAALLALGMGIGPAHATDATPTMPTIEWGTAANAFLTNFGTIFSVLLTAGVILLVIRRAWGWANRMLK